MPTTQSSRLRDIDPIALLHGVASLEFRID